MNQRSIIIQQPNSAVQQLFLLFHGYGAAPSDLVPVGQALAQVFPAAMIVSVAAPEPADAGMGLQWFSLQGITEDNRMERVQKALSRFVSTVQHWQNTTQVIPAATALIGFSQGGIMALEASKQADLLAGRVIAHSARYAQLPTALPETLSTHLIHGKLDAVIPYAHAVAALEALQGIDADFTADIIPDLGHTISEESLDVMVQRLQTHVPKRLWQEALQAAQNLQ